MLLSSSLFSESREKNISKTKIKDCLKLNLLAVCAFFLQFSFQADSTVSGLNLI